MQHDGGGGTASRRPRIVLVVDNHVSVDSRVQKTARAAADAGYDTVIVGRSTTQSRVETVVGGVRTILVVAPRYRASHAAQEPSRGHRPLAYPSAERARDRSRKLSAMRAGALTRTLELAERPPGLRTKASSFWRRARISWRQRLHNRRFAAFQANAADVASHRGWLRRPLLTLGLRIAPSSTWRRVGTELLDYDLAFASELAALKPDLIHSHDFPMLVVATNAKARAAQNGHSIAVLHDVHEWIAGAPVRDPVWRKAMHAAEVELIPRADAVVTVSDWLADSLQHDCGLAVRPSVITNAPEPVDELSARLAPSIRMRCGLADGVPLMVYSGSVTPGRGLATVVAALPQLPGVHLAIVVGSGPHKHVEELLAQAEAAGTADRVHRVGYVPQDLVVPHLASADVGLIPLHHAVNHEISLITKYREYMHAHLPIVVSDVRTMAEFTREHHTGEVFVAGDSDDLARAVRTVLADLPGYRAAFTDDLLAEHSWPVQAERLADLYAKLIGPAPQRRAVEPARLLPPPHSGTALIVGPTNMAGQGMAWALAATAYLDDVDGVCVTFEREGILQFATDLRITTAERQDPVWVDTFDREVVATRTHVLLENGMTLSGSSGDPDEVALHVRRLQAAGLSVAFAFHGSEVRDPREHEARYPWSNFPRADAAWREAVQRRVDEVREVLDRFGLPRFVSTPDQLTYVPDALWLPTIVDVRRFATRRSVLERDLPVVMHAPSRAATKGSDRIDPVLAHLDAEGVIAYRRLSGIRPERMPAEIAAADIVVEQVGHGLYGVAAMEAMAAGRLVVGQVGDVVREHVAEVTGWEVPIVEAGADDLEATIRGLVSDRDAGRATAAHGPDFVADVHDGRRSADVLGRWLGASASR